VKYSKDYATLRQNGCVIHLLLSEELDGVPVLTGI
jgi:hypothetical protein